MAASERLVAARSRAQVRSAERTARAEDVLVFGGAFVAGLAAAAVIFFGLELWHGDALSRTADAYLVLFSRDPHLGAIGFVWPPLPTALRVLLLPIMRPFGLAAFTGPLISVAFAAGAALVLNWVLRDMRVPGRARALWIAIAFANPVVLLHFTNGTAESALTFFILLTIYFYGHLQERPVTAVLGMGVACALALWTRYEAIALAVMAIAALVLKSWVESRHEDPRKWAERLEALLTALLAPVAFAGMLWLFMNWAIQDDPLFFYNSVYGARGAFEFARNVADHPLAYAHSDALGTLRYVGLRLVQLSFVFPLAAAGVALLALARRDQRGIALVLLATSTLFVQAYQAYTGGIAPWLRYWVYVPILAVVLLAYLSQALPGGRRWRTTSAAARYALVPALLLGANFVALRALHEPEVEAYERVFGQRLLGQQPVALDRDRSGLNRGALRAAAEHLRGKDGNVLVDLAQAPAFVIEIDDPARLVVNSDEDFEQLLERPSPSVRWLLLPDPGSANERDRSRDAVYQRYPGAYDGAPWLRLEREFRGAPNWRLYEVIANPRP